MGIIEIPYISDFARKHYTDGWIQGFIEARGEADPRSTILMLQAAVIELLKARDLRASPSQLDRLLEDSDVESLSNQVRRAAVAHDLADVFGGSETQGAPPA